MAKKLMLILFFSLNSAWAFGSGKLVFQPMMGKNGALFSGGLATYHSLGFFPVIYSSFTGLAEVEYYRDIETDLAALTAHELEISFSARFQSTIGVKTEYIFDLKEIRNTGYLRISYLLW